MSESLERPRAASGLSVAGLVVSAVALLLAFAGGGAIPAIVGVVLIAVGERGHAWSTVGKVGRWLALAAILLSVLVVVVRVLHP